MQHRQADARTNLTRAAGQCGGAVGRIHRHSLGEFEHRALGTFGQLCAHDFGQGHREVRLLGHAGTVELGVTLHGQHISAGGSGSDARRGVLVAGKREKRRGGGDRAGGWRGQGELG